MPTTDVASVKPVRSFPALIVTLKDNPAGVQQIRVEEIPETTVFETDWGKVVDVASALPRKSSAAAAGAAAAATIAKAS